VLNVIQAHPTLLYVPAGVEEAIALLKSWDYYDNKASGEYVNENQNIREGVPHYNRWIALWNCTIQFRGEVVWCGDLSFRRMVYLWEASKRFNLTFLLLAEHDSSAFYCISNGAVLKRDRDNGDVLMALVLAKAKGYNTVDEMRQAEGEPTSEQRAAAGLGALFG
jgi:hypothetical protein